MKIILEESEKESLKINIGDIIFISKNNDFNKLGKELVDTNHRFFVSGISNNNDNDNNKLRNDNGNNNNKLRIHVLSSNMSHVCKKYPDNVPVIDWKKAGLTKPSYINGNSNGYIDSKYVKSKVGSLTSRDFEAIMNTLRHRKNKINQRIEKFCKF